VRIAASLLSLVFFPAVIHAAVDPRSFQSLAFRQHPGAQLPLGAELVDNSGRSLSLATALGGKPAVVMLDYLRCKNLCSLVLTGAVHAIITAGLRPGVDVNLVAISIDPRDTPRDASAAQAMYARRFPDPVSASSGLRFLIARPDQVREISSAIGFPFRYDKQSDQFLHPAGFVVTTSAGKISRYVLGINPQPLLLKSAIAEAARNVVEPPAHPLLCLCFGYDPDEGSVAALTWQLVRWTCVGIVLACIAMIGFLSLRRRPA